MARVTSILQQPRQADPPPGRSLDQAGYVHLSFGGWSEGYRDARRTTNRRRESNKAAEKTTYLGCMLVKGFLRWCADRRGYLPRNPLTHVSVTKPPLVKQPGATKAQVDAILAGAPCLMDTIVAFLAMTGARSGEMALVRVQDVDFADNWVCVPTLKRKRTEIVVRRKIPLHARLKVYSESQAFMAKVPF